MTISPTIIALACVLTLIVAAIVYFRIKRKTFPLQVISLYAYEWDLQVKKDEEHQYLDVIDAGEKIEATVGFRGRHASFTIIFDSPYISRGTITGSSHATVYSHIANETFNAFILYEFKNEQLVKFRLIGQNGYDIDSESNIMSNFVNFSQYYK